jgi:N-terminal domain of NWD NACHT-NTPase
MVDYKKHLASLQGDGAASVDLSSRQSVKFIVNNLLDDQKKGQWRVSILGNDIKIREQAENLVKFLQWADPVITKAVSAQPYAALAWSGVSLLLPVGK